MEREADFGGMLRETASLVSDAARDVAAYVLIVGGMALIGLMLGVPTQQENAFGIDFGFSFDEQTPLVTSIFQLGTTIVSVVAGYWLLTRYLVVRGRFGGGNRFWPYLGMAIVSIIGIVFGFALLIVPGFILLVRWSTASGFVIGAREGVFDSLQASWRATKGHGWPIFFAGVVLFLGMILVGGAVGALFLLLGTTAGAAAAGLLEAAGSAIAMAFGIAVYCLLHDDAAQLGEVFA